MKLHILSIAQVELEDAISYYNSEQPGLGFEFAVELKRTFDRILKFPFAWHKLSANTRRCRVKRFPYGVVYAIEREEILVLAIMHMRRHPDSWRERNKR